MINCVGCRKSRLLHYVSPIRMSDTRMLPTVHPMSMISINPIMSWPVLMPDLSTKKLPVSIILCRQTGFVWHKILIDWTKKSLTMALMILQYRFGKINHIISDRGSNLIPSNLILAVNNEGEEKRLMDLLHVQPPVGGQHANVVELKIGLVKQFSRNIVGKVKG